MGGIEKNFENFISGSLNERVDREQGWGFSNVDTLGWLIDKGRFINFSKLFLPPPFRDY